MVTVMMDQKDTRSRCEDVTSGKRSAFFCHAKEFANTHEAATELYN